MGVCVWHAASTVSLRQCAVAHNTNYPMGIRDGATVAWHGAGAAADEHVRAEERGKDSLGSPRASTVPLSVASVCSWACPISPPAMPDIMVPELSQDAEADLDRESLAALDRASLAALFQSKPAPAPACSPRRA